jgi:hypothetical protein
MSQPFRDPFADNYDDDYYFSTPNTNLNNIREVEESDEDLGKDKKKLKDTKDEIKDYTSLLTNIKYEDNLKSTTSLFCYLFCNEQFKK